MNGVTKRANDHGSVASHPSPCSSFPSGKIANVYPQVSVKDLRASDQKELAVKDVASHILSGMATAAEE